MKRIGELFKKDFSTSYFSYMKTSKHSEERKLADTVVGHNRVFVLRIKATLTVIRVSDQNYQPPSSFSLHSGQSKSVA